MLEHYLRPVAAELDLEVVRGDETGQPGSILRQVVEHLTACSVAVADLTGFNPNVMYELAVAHSFRRPTVLVQRTTSNDRLPFDVVQERVIQFDPALTDDRRRALTELRGQLKACLDGRVDSPVSTTMDLLHLEKERDGKELSRVLDTILWEIRSSRPAAELEALLSQTNVNPSRLIELGRAVERLLLDVDRFASQLNSAGYDASTVGLTELQASARRIERISHELGPSTTQKVAKAWSAVDRLSGGRLTSEVMDRGRSAIRWLVESPDSGLIGADGSSRSRPSSADDEDA